MKRLIVCCDGTWQSQNNKVATNVLKIAQGVKTTGEDERGNEIAQILYYDQGIGAVPNYGAKQPFLKSISEFLQKLGGGAFGWGIDEKIEEAYIFLCLNYEPDDEIYLFGFSRGAYTVRSLAGLISCCGLLQRPDINHTAEAYEIYRNRNQEERQQKADNFRREHEIEDINIKFLGCWDTVCALGLPNLISWLPIDKFFAKKYKFHDNKLGSIIENARHAIAIDEKRSAFEVTLMEPGYGFEKENLKQVWFPGEHGCVGGGTKEQMGLSDGALQWMIDESKALGLEFDESKIPGGIDPDPTIPFCNTSKGILIFTRRIFRKVDFASLHPSVIERWSKVYNYRPKNLSDYFNSRAS